MISYFITSLIWKQASLRLFTVNMSPLIPATKSKVYAESVIYRYIDNEQSVCGWQYIRFPPGE